MKHKITFEDSKIKATFEYPAEYSAKEVVVLFSHIMSVMGFQQETIDMLYLTAKNEKGNYTDFFKDEYSMLDKDMRKAK
jgi:hypothetical protein